MYFSKMILLSAHTPRDNNLLKSLSAHGLSVLIIAINLGSPFILLDGVRLLKEENIDLNKLMFCLGSYGMMTAAGKFLSNIRDMLLISTGADLARSLTNRVICKFFQLPMEYRASNSAAPEVQYYNNSYWTIASNSARPLFGCVIPTIIETTIASGLLASLYSYPMGISLAGILGTYSISATVGSVFLYKASDNFLKHAFKTYERLIALLGRYENAHYYNNVQKELLDFDKHLQDFNKSYNKKFFVIDIVSGIQNIISQFGFSVLLLHAAYNVHKEIYSLDDFFLIFAYGMHFANSLSRFSTGVSELYYSYASFKEIADYLEYKTVLDYPDIPLDINHAPTIEFRNVCFSYSNKSILNDFSCIIPSGKKIAIVGLSGAGKSTIVKLLFRFYEPSSGKLLIDNQDISQVSLQSLRSKIAIVPQQINIINDTIINNIKYAKPNAQYHEINQAIRLSGLEDFIKEYGGHTSVGENGSKISGGQRQRIGLARAYIKNAPILILDEATTGLDKPTEQQVLKNFNLIAQGKTTFIVTHKLETIQHADLILLVKDGKLIASGTYGQLRENSEFFNELTSPIEDKEFQSDHDIQNDILQEDNAIITEPNDELAEIVVDNNISLLKKRSVGLMPKSTSEGPSLEASDNPYAYFNKNKKRNKDKDTSPNKDSLSGNDTDDEHRQAKACGIM